MTTSNEAIAAAREMFPEPDHKLYPPLLEQLKIQHKLQVESAASILQKHYAAKDAEIETLKDWKIKAITTLNEQAGFIEIYKAGVDQALKERDQLKAQLAMALDAAAKGEAGRNMGIAYEECQKENVELIARVAELEKALTNIKERVWWRLSGAEQHILTEAELKDIQKQCDVLSTTSSALTRLQELERKAKALDDWEKLWPEIGLGIQTDQSWSYLLRSTGKVYPGFKTLLECLEAATKSAMEKQK